jgi:hypothetical protein
MIIIIKIAYHYNRAPYQIDKVLLSTQDLEKMKTLTLAMSRECLVIGLSLKHILFNFSHYDYEHFYEQIQCYFLNKKLK